MNYKNLILKKNPNYNSKLKNNKIFSFTLFIYLIWINIFFLKKKLKNKKKLKYINNILKKRKKNKE